MADHTLLTGATGLLGRYLLRNVVSRGTPVAVLVRPGTDGGSAGDRLRSMLHVWESRGGPRLPEPVCLQGDVRLPGLGLDERDRAWMREHCRRVVHVAALLRLHGSARDGEPWTTNLQGTRHLLDVCREAEVAELHHVSTAYVCGRRQGRILEAELDEGQEFRNDYEASKLEAEQRVRAREHFDSVTVYRPAVISGDSATGYTHTYHGLYLYLRLMAMMVPAESRGPGGVRHTPIRLPMSGDEPRNVVPVDWVADVMTHLIGTDDAHGRTYHLAPDRPLTPREITDACCKYFASTGVEYMGPDFRHDPSSMSDFERRLLDNMSAYDPYSLTDPVFDTANLERFAGHLPCPRIDEGTLHRYLDYAEEDEWGRRTKRLRV